MAIREIVSVQGLSGDKLAELSNYLVTCFNNSLTARRNQIDNKYQNWIKNYEAQPAQTQRTTPFIGASNFIPSLIRMHSDILHARLLGTLIATRPFWNPKTFNSLISNDETEALGEYLERVCNLEMNFFPSLDEITSSFVKEGTCIAKLVPVAEKLRSYAASNQAQLVDINECRLDVLHFQDFFPYPLTARDLTYTSAQMQRLRVDKRTIEDRKNQGLWNRESCDVLLSCQDKPDQNLLQGAQASGVILTADVVLPFSCVEAWFKYDLGTGVNDSLVCVFNPMVIGAKGILRLYYNYHDDPRNTPFVDFRLIPRKGLFYGYSIPEILESSQEEQSHIHNARRDANTISNIPAWKKKRGSEVASPNTQWYPGKVFEVDSMDDMSPLTGPGNYNSMIDEENMIIGLAERYTGISQAMQGMGAGSMGKRNVYANTGTLALLAEGNRRLDIYIKRLRYPMHLLGSRIVEYKRNFSEQEILQEWGENGQLVQKALEQAKGNQSRYFYDIAASDAGSNRETDRSALLLLSNTASGYYNQLMQAAQTLAQMPPDKPSPVRELLLQIVEGGADLFRRILVSFNVDDRKKLVPNLRQLMGGGGPQGAPGSAQPQPASGPTGPISPEQFQALSQYLNQVSGAGAAPTGQPS